jgi:acyl dehydratase
MTSHIDQLTVSIGGEYGVTGWFMIEQRKVDIFGQVTDDDDPMHSNIEWARTGPFGVPVAHGMYILSLLPRFARELGFPIASSGSEMAINYGFDRVRWIKPVPVGSSVRCRTTITKVELKGATRWLVHSKNAIECDAHAGPCVVADWLCLYEYAP